jgi:hypothetical protein
MNQLLIKLRTDVFINNANIIKKLYFSSLVHEFCVETGTEVH